MQKLMVNELPITDDDELRTCWKNYFTKLAQSRTSPSKLNQDRNDIVHMEDRRWEMGVLSGEIVGGTDGGGGWEMGDGRWEMGVGGWEMGLMGWEMGEGGMEDERWEMEDRRWEGEEVSDVGYMEAMSHGFEDFILDYPITIYRN